MKFFLEGYFQLILVGILFGVFDEDEGASVGFCELVFFPLIIIIEFNETLQFQHLWQFFPPNNLIFALAIIHIHHQELQCHFGVEYSSSKFPPEQSASFFFFFFFDISP